MNKMGYFILIWEVLHVDLSAYGFSFRTGSVSGCTLGGHSAYGYFDMGTG